MSFRWGPQTRSTAGTLVIEALRLLLVALPQDAGKLLLDDLIDVIESWGERPGNRAGRAVLAVCTMAREVLAIPDDIGGDAD